MWNWKFGFLTSLPKKSKERTSEELADFLVGTTDRRHVARSPALGVQKET